LELEHWNNSEEDMILAPVAILAESKQQKRYDIQFIPIFFLKTYDFFLFTLRRFLFAYF